MSDGEIGRVTVWGRGNDGFMRGWSALLSITVDPDILAGKPVVRGTRLAVEFILELLAAGQSESEILANYPGLTREDILACLSYASYLVTCAHQTLDFTSTGKALDGPCRPSST